MRVISTILLLILILSGCVQLVDQSNCEVISIGDAFEKKSKVLLSEYVSDIDYIPLETNPECMLDGAESLNIRVFEDRIYIYNGDLNFGKGRLLPLLFNSDGTFVSSIGSIGNSDNEFVNIKQMMIDTTARQLVIVDYNRFLFYTLTGKFRRAVDVVMNSTTHFAIYSADGNYIYLKNPSLIDEGAWNKDFLVKVDSMGKKTGTVLLNRILLDQPGTPMGTVKVTKGANLFQSSGDLYVYRSNDSLYKVNPLNLTLKPEFFIDFGKYATTSRAGATLWARDNPLFVTPRAVALTVLFVYGTFPDIDRKYTRTNFVYDRKRGTTRALEYNEDYGYAGFTNDIDGGMLFYPKYMNEGKMYQLVDAIDFIEYAQKSNSQKMKQVAATLTEESNPVVVVATLKE
ncbi:MAG: 6-bladed beta-propeller [Bacteroidales bacterium]|nr:6-bladed beta-propeller [Bacteroidales bacterium]